MSLRPSSPDRPPGAHGRPPRRWRALGTALVLSVAGFAPAVGVTGFGAAPAQAALAADEGDGNCLTKGLSTICYFSYTGAKQRWVVPSGVTEATFEVIGAAGGSGVAAGTIPGGVGGGVRARIQLDRVSSLEINVGGKGADRTGQGGWNGGGNGAGTTPYGGGGGGASDVRMFGASLENRVLVGGGGGGSGSAAVGYKGPFPPGQGGAGGSAGASTSGPSAGAGLPGQLELDSPFHGAKGGRGGSAGPGAGGAASADRSGVCSGFPGLGQPGETGVLAAGGHGGHFVNYAGKHCYELRGWGGGGGGGYFGGGGGAAGAFNGAGGGGGSSFGPARSTTLKGQPGAHGLVTLTYLISAGDWIDQGISASSDPVIAKRGGYANVVDLFWLDANRQAWHRSYTDGVPGPDTNMGGVLYPGSSLAAVSTGPNRIDVFARGTESALWQNTFNGTGWSGWAARTTPNQLASSPTVASWGPGRVDVFARGAGNTLVQFWGNNNIPSNQYNLGGTVLGAPSAVSWGPDRIDIVYPGSGLPGISDTGWKTWDPTLGGWQSEQRLAFDSFHGGPAIASGAAGYLQIWWQGEDTRWLTSEYSSEGWSGLAVTDRPPGAGSRSRPSGASTYEAFYLAGLGGPDGRGVWLRAYRR